MSVQHRIDARHPLPPPHHHLPAIDPDDARRALVTLQRDDATFRNIAASIQKSAPLTQLVLRLAHAVVHGLPPRPMTVEHAVGVLGLKKLREALLPLVAAPRSKSSEAA